MSRQGDATERLTRRKPSVSRTRVVGFTRASEVCLMVAASVITGSMLAMAHEPSRLGEFVVVSAITIAIARGVAERQDIYRFELLRDPHACLVRLCLVPVAGAMGGMAALALLRDRAMDVQHVMLQPVAWALASGALLLASRSATAWRLQTLARAGRCSKRVALVGANASSLQFIQQAGRDPDVDIVGIYDDRETRLSEIATRTWLRGDVTALIALIRREPLDAVVISLPIDATDRIATVRRRLAGIDTNIYLPVEIPALAHPGACITSLGSSRVVSIVGAPLGDGAAFKKALFDRIASALILTLALPLMAAIAVAIRLGSPGTILFRQEREGLNGMPFTMLKFRTMYNRPPGDEFVQATPNDRRVTPIGYWLRRFSLDELPQLWNVLRGDMSLVGPRPHLATTRAGNRLFCDVVPLYQARHRMKPGVTGWAQVHGFRGETRTELDITERVAHDIYYIENWSLGLDLRILGRTVMSEIFSRSGRAY